MTFQRSICKEKERLDPLLCGLSQPEQGMSKR